MLFSVLIPAYKSKYLKRCINSVLSQTYIDFEIVIVNDASPENLDAIVSDFSDNRIRYYKNEKNCGAFNVVDNWNICLEKSKGDYVICIGDDDELMPNCLALYNDAIIKNPDIDIFHCRSYIIDEVSNKISMTPSWPVKESVYDNIWHRIFNHRVQFIGDFLYRRDVLVNKGGFYKLPMAWGSDDITSFIIMADKGVVHINEPLFCYRQALITLSSSGNVSQKIEAINKEEEWYKQFIQKIQSKSAQDIVLFNNIRDELPHYFKIKRINTIAYNGFKGNIIERFIFWYRKKNLVKLNMKELIYVTILACKYRITRYEK